MRSKKINILHVVQSLQVGGAEVLLLHYIEALGSVNYLHYVYYFGPKGWIAEKLTDLGAILVPGKKRTEIKNPIRFVRSHILLLLDLLEFIQKNRIHVILSHLGQANQLSVVAGKLTKIPAFPTVHNTMAFVDRRQWYDIRKNLIKIIDNLIYRIADQILVVSNEVKNIVKKTFHIDSSKITILKNGIIFDDQQYSKTDLTNVFQGSGEKIKIIAVGSLTYQKAMDVLLRSAGDLIDQKFFNFFVFIVGEGEERKLLEALVRKLNLEKHVKLLGLRNDAINLIKSCDIFVMPSRYEGLSIAMIEAMACGMPIIASDAPGLRNYIKHQENGLLFPIEDHMILAKRIFTLAHDQALRSRVSQAARKTYENEYDMSKNIKTLDKLLFEYSAY
jgi:glycosyltransferase involved in cell wall biosynthesis